MRLRNLPREQQSRHGGVVEHVECEAEDRHESQAPCGRPPDDWSTRIVPHGQQRRQQEQRVACKARDAGDAGQRPQKPWHGHADCERRQRRPRADGPHKARRRGGPSWRSVLRQVRWLQAGIGNDGVDPPGRREHEVGDLLKRVAGHGWDEVAAIVRVRVIPLVRLIDLLWPGRNAAALARGTERLLEGRHCRVSCVGVHGKRPLQHRFGRRRNVDAKSAWQHHLVAFVSVERFGRNLTRQRSIDGCAERVDVGPRTLIPLGLVLFFRGIPSFENHRQALALVAQSETCGAEIEQLDLPRVGNVNVVRADVAMKQTDLVDGAQRVHHGHGNRQRLLVRQAAASRDEMLLHRPARDIAHNQVTGTVRLEVVQHRHDTWMIVEPRNGASLFEELGQTVLEVLARRAAVGSHRRAVR